MTSIGVCSHVDPEDNLLWCISDSAPWIVYGPKGDYATAKRYCDRHHPDGAVHLYETLNSR